MKKLILASASGIALFGLAACSDTDGTTTQAVPEDVPPLEQPADPNAAPPPPAEPMTPPAAPDVPPVE